MLLHEPRLYYVIMNQVLRFEFTQEECEKFNDRAKSITLVPFEHLNIKVGKNIRKRISNVYNHWFQLPNDKLDTIGNIVQTCHNVSLLIDDIQDQSPLRRGIPSAHIIYGIARTIAAAERAALIMEEQILSLDRFKMLKMTGYILISALKGQIMDTYWRDNFICPTEEEYIDMISKKTGCIFRLIGNLMKELSNFEGDFDNISNLIGLHFQIADDYLNLKSKIYFEGKGFCEDITEGKFSFPIVYAIHSRPNDKRIINILSQHTTDIQLKKECLMLIEECGSFQYSIHKLKSIQNQLRNEIYKYGDNPHIEELFKVIVNDELQATCCQ